MTDATVTFPRRLVGIGVLVALLPALGFLFAYLYEVSYLDAFGIEASFAEVDVTAVVAVAYRFTGFVVIATLIAQTANWGIARMSFARGARMYYYVLAEALLVGLFIYWLAWGLDTTYLVRGLVFLAVVAVVGGPLLWFVFRLGRGSAAGESDLTQLLTRLVDSGYFPYAAALVLLGLGSAWFGEADATRQKSFLVAATDPTIVVIRQYDDRAVAVRRVAPGFVSGQQRIVLRFGDGDAVVLKRVDIGPLKVRPPRESRPKSSGPPTIQPIPTTTTR